jgi:hypothetical protein
LFQITPSSSTNFPGFFFQFIAIFTELFSFRNVLNRKRIRPLGPTCQPPHFCPGPPVGGCLAHRCHAPTKSSAPRVFKDVAVPTGSVRRHRLVSTVSATAPLRTSHRRSSPPHRPFTSRRSMSPCHPATAWLPRQRCLVLPLRYHRARAASLLGLPTTPSSESLASSRLTRR